MRKQYLFLGSNMRASPGGDCGRSMRYAVLQRGMLPTTVQECYIWESCPWRAVCKAGCMEKGVLGGVLRLHGGMGPLEWTWIWL